MVCSLAGDVFLMVPGDRFVPGLVSFLLAHLAYVVGLLQLDLSAPFLAVGLVVAAVIVGVVGTKIIGAVRSSGHDELVVPVGVYIVAIAAMATAAFATGDARAIVGRAAVRQLRRHVGVGPLRRDRGRRGPGRAWPPARRRAVGGESVTCLPAAPAPFGLPGNIRTWIHVTYQVGQALIVLSLL